MGKISRGIKSNFNLEREEDYTASLLQHSTLNDILKHLLLPSYACLTDNWWSCWMLAMDIEELYFKWTYIRIYPLVILVKYSASDYYSWSQILSLLFLKADVATQFLMSNIIVDKLLKSYNVLKFLKSEIVVELFPKSATVVQFLKSKIIVKFLKLNTWFLTRSSLYRSNRVLHRAVFFTLFFALYWCNANWHFLKLYKSFYF